MERRRIGEVKHKYAIDEFGNSVSILQASKFVNSKKVSYFLFDNESLEVIPKQGDKNRWHFAIKSDAKIKIAGKSYNYSNFGESPEHLDFKYQIMKDGFFEWNGYKIYVYNVKVEAKIYGSMFKADCTGVLQDGNKVFIEVIKTSETSKRKKEYLKENDLLTFEISIDDEGNQKHERFDCYGNREIERIEESIQEMQSRIPNCEREKGSAWREYYQEKERVEQRIQRMEEAITDKMFRESGNSEFDNRSINHEINKRRHKARSIIKESRKILGRIREYENIFRLRSESIRNQIRDNFIPEDTIQSNKKLLREYRKINGY